MLSATKPLSENLPAHGCRHVAIIMDGNGRWAKKQGKIRAFGHKAGAKSVRRAVSFAANNGIDALTLYAFSSENWNRPAQEVSALMELFVWALDSEVKNLHRHNVRLRIIGDISRFNSRLQERIPQIRSDYRPEYRVDAKYCSELRWTVGYSPGSQTTGTTGAGWSAASRANR
ncbi:UDP pyrophosphate synthetase [Citrobacter freundii]|nr:UDP pyrophosphate synthetase [Citrobacter freundii]